MSPHDCQKLTILSPNKSGTSQFHNHLVGNPNRIPERSTSAINTRILTTALPTFSYISASTCSLAIRTNKKAARGTPFLINRPRYFKVTQPKVIKNPRPRAPGAKIPLKSGRCLVRYRDLVKVRCDTIARQ